MNIFKEVLYLEDLIDQEGNRKYVRELQKSITYNKNDFKYPKAWINEDLTDQIINKFIESKSFQEELVLIEPVIEDPEIHEDDVYQEILKLMKERELDVTLEDIIRILNILRFTPDQIYDPKFIEVYNNHQHLSNGELEEILVDWIKGQQKEEIYEEILSESGDVNTTEDEEILINTPPEIPSPLSESFNSTGSNSPNNLIMATENHVK